MRGAGQGIVENITFTPSVARNQYTLKVAMAQGADEHGDITHKCVSCGAVMEDDSDTCASCDTTQAAAHAEEGVYNVVVPYGAQLIEENNAIKVYDPQTKQTIALFECNIKEESVNSHHFSGWDLSELVGTSIVTDCSIYANVDLTQYKISVKYKINGTVVTSDNERTIVVDYGTALDFDQTNPLFTVAKDTADEWWANAEPKDGYDFSNWTVKGTRNNEEVVAPNTEQVECDMVFTASFAQGVIDIYVGVDAESSAKANKSVGPDSNGDLDTPVRKPARKTQVPNYVEFYEVSSVSGHADNPIYTTPVTLSLAENSEKTPCKYEYFQRDGWNYTVITGYFADEAGTVSQSQATKVYKSRINPSIENSKLLYSFKGFTVNGFNMGGFSGSGTPVKNDSFNARYELIEYTITLKVNDSALYKQGSAAVDKGVIEADYGDDDPDYDRTFTFTYKNSVTIEFSKDHEDWPPTDYESVVLYCSRTDNNMRYFALTDYITPAYNKFVDWKIVSNSASTSTDKFGDEFYYGGNITIEAVYEETTATITYTSLDPSYNTNFGYVGATAADTSKQISITEEIHKYSGDVSELSGAYAIGENFDELCTWVDDKGNVVKAYDEDQGLTALRHFVPEVNPDGGSVWNDHTYYILFIPAVAIYNPSSGVMTFTCERGANEGVDKSYIFPVYSTYFDESRNLDGLYDTGDNDFELINGTYDEAGPVLRSAFDSLLGNLGYYANVPVSKEEQHLDYASWQYSDLTWKVHPEKITFDSSFAKYKGVKGTANWFNTYKENPDVCKLTSITNLGYLYTNNITDMEAMFMSYVTPVHKWDTGGGTFIVNPKLNSSGLSSPIIQGSYFGPEGS